ncbi:MAG: ABC transporter permease [Labrenzia sp.]
MLQNVTDFLPLILEGAWITVALSITSVFLSILFGILGAAAKLSESLILRGIGAAYTTLVRGVPELVLMLIIFFGGQLLINEIGSYTGLFDRIPINQFFAGSVAIGIIFGSYMAETFRAAYLSIPEGQIDAAKAFGMPARVWLIHVVWPQFVPLVLPGFTNNWLILMKTTAVVSIIGLQDVTFMAQQAGRSTSEPFVFLFIAFLVYLLITYVSDLCLRILERRYRHV